MLDRRDVVPGMVAGIQTHGQIADFHPHVHAVTSHGAFIPVRYEDSCLVVPEGPGLGIEVDLAYLEAIRYRSTRLQQLRG